MKELIRFLKASGIYFIGTVLIKLVSFLMLPIYTKYISPEDMGTYDLASAYITFLCSVLYLDIWAGIMRFMFEHDTREKKKKPINSGFAIFLLSTAVYTAIIIGVGCVAHIPYLFYIYLFGLLMNTQILFGYLARGFGKNVLYASSGLIGTLVTTVSNIILIVVFKMNYSAMFISGCIGYMVNIAIVGYGIRAHELISVKKFDYGIFKQMFRFSIPLCMNSVAYWFLTSYNRVAISNILGKEANGLYAVATRFGSVINLFTSCFNMAWQEISYSKEATSDSDNSNFYSVAINSFIQFLGMGLILLVPVVFFVFPIMIDDSYNEAKNMVPIYLLATIASSTSSFLGNIFSAIKKNDILFFTTVVGSIVNVICVHLLLPVLGVQGASIALFLGFLINVIIRIRILSKEIRVKMDMRFIGMFTILTAGVTFVYIKLSYIGNLVAFAVGVFATIYVFRDVIGKVYLQIKVKLRKK
ncbi:lipopolysaccharide biosynthesis protein [Lactonifactor longoviformis]|uniref:Membrane protein involved in the export of O-antigen and teichoic acid n=2 Tax=Lactonifactor TaxID=420345 RepID=A0A1M5AQ80_9CLOT|nr:oligosaccharide flippase family protein [Lactonifactor longoviformis]SHF32082.1 Membrane protein involved in the export of O-antigen and teichoic acid [Lactonifactor longoviformis DSM 17459]